MSSSVNQIESDQAGRNGRRPTNDAPSVGPVGIDRKPVSLGDFASLTQATREEIRKEANPGQRAALAFHEDRVEQIGTLLSNKEAELRSFRAAQNEDNERFNEMTRRHQSDYEAQREKVESEDVAPLQEQVAQEHSRRESTLVDLRTAEADAAHIEASIAKAGDIEQGRKGLPVAGRIKPIEKVIEWGARIVLAAVEALSLGLLTEFINPYRPVSIQLLLLFPIGLAITVLGGEALKFMATQAARNGDTLRQRLGRIDRKWAWILIPFAALIISVGMSVTLYGVLAALNANSVLAAPSGENTVPLIVLLMCTSTFVVPYSVFEICLGYKSGQKMHQDDFASARAAEKELVVESASEARLAALRTSIGSLRAQAEICDSTISRLESEIARLRAAVIAPVFMPPYPYTGSGVATYTSLPQVAIPLRGTTEIMPAAYPLPDTPDVLAARKLLETAIAERDAVYKEVIRELREDHAIVRRIRLEDELRSRRVNGVLPKVKQFMFGR